MTGENVTVLEKSGKVDVAVEEAVAESHHELVESSKDK